MTYSAWSTKGRLEPHSNSSTKAWDMVQATRRTLVKDYCKKVGLLTSLENMEAKSRSRLLKTVIVDEKHRVLYCPIGKVASTSWKTVMAILQGHYTGLRRGEHIHDQPVLLRNGLKLLGMYSPSKQQSLLRDFKSFLFVRHPFERLLSAYRNKFLTKNQDNYQKRYGTYIISKYRHGASAEEVKSGMGVRFEEFLLWLLDTNNQDIHWDFHNNICQLCTLRYHYIGLMDTFEEDSRNILSKLFQSNMTGVFPHSNPSHENSRDVLRRYFMQIPPDTIDRTKRKYDIDFKMFNFTSSLV